MKIRSFSVAVSAAVVVVVMSLVASGAQAQSVTKQCGEEWKAAKANNATNGQTWQEFLKSCRAQKAAAAPAAAPAPAPAPAAIPVPSPAPAPAPVQSYQPKPAPVPMRTAARPTGAGEFTSEAEAKARCPSDTVVWVNTKSKIYHYAGARGYGTTKQGAYMCEADANAAGDRASKSRIGQKKQQPQ